MDRIEPQNTNSSNQSDTSSEDQQPYDSQPSDSFTPEGTSEENEWTLNDDDMFTGQFSEKPTKFMTFTISDIKIDDNDA